MSRLSREVGEALYLVATIRGPLNMASQVRGVEQLMLGLTDDPAFVRDLLDFCVAVGEAFGGALVGAGANAIAIGEALCSPAFISPRTYRSFVHSRHRDLIGRLEARGAETTLLHICGDIRPIIPDLAATGVDAIDVDWQVDLSEANRLAGGSLALRGNLDPSAVLLLGTRDEVLAKAGEAIGRAAGARFILGSGCDVAPTTPPANVEALVEAAAVAARGQEGEK
jgi:MtaA/CmuA family methyltransferase